MIVGQITLAATLAILLSGAMPDEDPDKIALRAHILYAMELYADSHSTLMNQLVESGLPSDRADLLAFSIVSSTAICTMKRLTHSDLLPANTYLTLLAEEDTYSDVTARLADAFSDSDIESFYSEIAAFTDTCLSEALKSDLHDN